MRPIMLNVFAALVALLGLLLLALVLVSPGHPVPLLDAAGNPLRGSLSEKIFVEVNGTRQGMFIKSRDVANPVLLYVHGGMPDYFLTHPYPDLPTSVPTLRSPVLAAKLCCQRVTASGWQQCRKMSMSTLRARTDHERNPEHPPSSVR